MDWKVATLNSYENFTYGTKASIQVALVPFPCWFLHQYKERVQKRCVYCVIWQYCVFSQKFAATFGQELTLFCTSSVWRIFWHVNSSTNTKREFTKKDCFLCDSTLLFVFKKKVCILWAQTCSFLCTLSRLWLLFVNDSFLLLCFVLAIWKCHNFTSLHVCYLIFNYSSPPTGCFCLFGWQWQWHNVGSGSGSFAPYNHQIHGDGQFAILWLLQPRKLEWNMIATTMALFPLLKTTI
jgi:hypothetical protein